MTLSARITEERRSLPVGLGFVWFLLATIAAGIYFNPGITALLAAWTTPEYSHGPLIPILSGLLFLRQLRTANITSGPVQDRGQGVVVICVALVLGAAGRLIQIPDLMAYAIIVWVAGMLLLTFGWKQGRQFWPPVLHLVFMLPLPGVLYYGLSIYLQGVSSELGVFFLRLVGVPVFLDGNIIDLGVYKLQVAEACSGLRYLFPILSFSYVFSVLYRGPLWHKAFLLLAAVPLTIVMNSIRIAIAGVVVDRFGTAFVEGITHFLEGWVIFLACVLLLFAMARILLFFRTETTTLVAALDLDFQGLWPHARKIATISTSAALVSVAILTSAAALAWQVIPARPLAMVERESFYNFPHQLGDWTAGVPRQLTADVEQVLSADDYLSLVFTEDSSRQQVEFFSAWYKDQMTGGTHSPTDCLPGAGWEISRLDQVAVEHEAGSFEVNRAVIQQGLNKMLVYYWYEQQGERTTSAYYSRFLLTRSKVLTGRSDGALVRLVTPLAPDEDPAIAETRLQSLARQVIVALPRFVPGP